ncbi:hypothetical protein B296_00023739 [Ensete ventricosum]|uniref:Uncharacterized protein n=1 Tax=Ensete ventricosum TaxID=4639 RepID=A0A426Y6M7_ENSVE|nr:hypothetical protein B296_00023739 [Ensete ventricosum]
MPVATACVRGNHRHYERAPLLCAIDVTFIGGWLHDHRLCSILPTHGCRLSAAIARKWSLLPICSLLLSHDCDAWLLPAHDRRSTVILSQPACCSRNRRSAVVLP